MENPWGDLTSWLQTMVVTSARYTLMRDALGETGDVGSSTDNPP